MENYKHQKTKVMKQEFSKARTLKTIDVVDKSRNFGRWEGKVVREEMERVMKMKIETSTQNAFSRNFIKKTFAFFHLFSFFLSFHKFDQLIKK